MNELLRTLCDLPGISGFEDAVRDYIRTALAPFADEMHTDAAGNLVVFKRGRNRPKNRVLFAAHMDEVGFLVTHITEDGLLKFGTVGGFDPRVLLGRRVRVGDAAVPGIISIKAIHLFEKEERENVPAVSALSIDIGATDRTEAEAAVSLGDPVVFDTEYTEYGDGRVLAKALDDRVGCLALMELCRSDLAYDTWFGFTVGEELGLGAAFLAETLCPDRAVICEGTTAADLPGTPDHRKVCRQGDGAVLVYMDNRTVYHPAMFRAVSAAAEKIGAPYQVKEYISGGTDAGAIHVSAKGVRCAGIAVAVRSIHSSASTASLADIRAMCDIARACTESEEIYND
ncbi:MAG: M42 family peptidase [Clostridia bacterium]|nr:M42 family peptidase [Clostridia bacterium]